MIRRSVTLIAATLLLAACGGGGIGSYKEGADAQTEVMTEMLSVLKGVKDEASAKAAAGKIEALGTRMGEIAKQMAELPRPSDAELQEVAKEQSAKVREFQQDAAEQMMKIAQYPDLQQAWMRAMENMQK